MAGLFDMFKKPKAQEPVKIGSFVNAKNFRGFKKFPMEVNIDPIAKRNNEALRGVDTSGAVLDFYDIAPDKISVHFNGTYIGYISNNDRINDLRSGRITDFHVKFEEDHVFDGAHEEYRFRAHLLAKYKG